jgi:hypothetical protein
LCRTGGLKRPSHNFALSDTGLEHFPLALNRGFDFVMLGHSRSKNGVASLAYVPGIHVLAAKKGVDGRAFARRSLFRLRQRRRFGPRRRDKPGHDKPD